MEQDFKDRSQRIRRDRKMAEEFKVKGNEAMKRGLYKSARHYYNQALDHKKDILAIYTNRALVCLKLEEFQQVIDDTSRVLEYYDVFDNEVSAKTKDLCYKALMRRGQALKYQKDWKLALADFVEAKKFQKEGETDTDKWIKLTSEDQLHEEKITNIMSNAGQLKGKEYIDYILGFLKGKNSDAPKAVSKV